jgi:transcriptional regulator with GAF, ATPase, and Fis domain
MVVINCAALPELLLESELFGHEKGSFTGATAAKSGLIEVADGGTMFLDEIGEMAAPLQAKLLRVLEDGWIRRVGTLRERHVDVRLLTATKRQLRHEVARGRFREDLFYRINVLQLDMPPLRHREDDIRSSEPRSWPTITSSGCAICHRRSAVTAEATMSTRGCLWKAG